MDIGSVLYLYRSDLTKAAHKVQIEDVDLSMCKCTDRKQIELATLVIYVEGTDYKVLKSRYFDKEKHK